MQAWHIPPLSMWLAHAGFPQMRQVVVVGDWHKWQSEATIPIRARLKAPAHIRWHNG